MRSCNTVGIATPQRPSLLRLSWGRQAPFRAARLPSAAPKLACSRRVLCRSQHRGVVYLDADDYQEGLDYDSDDYEHAWAELDSAPVRAASSRGSSSSSSRGGVRLPPDRAAATADTAASAAAPMPGAQAAEQQQQHEQEASAAAAEGEAHEPLRTGLSALLLLAAVGVFLRRMQEALVATGSAALLLLQQLAGHGSVHARALALKARRSLRRSRAGERVKQLRQNAQSFVEQLPEGFWGKLLWLWDRPPVQKLRLTWSLANISIKLPAVLALVATQVGLLASQVSLPMLAPLLLGTGMLLRSIKSNASFLLPRIGLFVVLAWLLWFANSVVQSTTAYLRKQGAIDHRIASAVITASECSALLGALLILLSMLGVNIGSALLLPAGIAVAIAAKDLSHNWLAGFFLFVAQPFKMGDRVAVSFSAPGAPGAFTSNWFEGVCEKIDLRYTQIRQGGRRLMVPNSAFLTREFMILDDVPAPRAEGGAGAQQAQQQQAAVNGINGTYPAGSYGGAGQQHAAWQMQHMMQQPPYHQELLSGAAAAMQPPAPPPAPGGEGGEAAKASGAGGEGRQQPAEQQQQQGGAFAPPPPTIGAYMYQPQPQPSLYGRSLPGYNGYAAPGYSSWPPGHHPGYGPMTPQQEQQQRRDGGDGLHTPNGTSTGLS